MSHQLSKKFKPNESGELEMASASKTPSTSPIFRLNVDCLEEIFDLLSLKELHAIGQTCKRMQSVAGYFFQQNYSHRHINYVYETQTILCSSVKISGFIRFIRRIEIFNTNFIETFHYIESNPFDSLKYISFENVKFQDEHIAHAEKTLSKIEGLTLNECSLNGDLYERILIFCPHLKKLNIKVGPGRNCGKLIGNGNNWLLRKYPNLEHFGMLTHYYLFEIKEMNKFLVINSGIKTLLTDVDFLLAHKKSISGANIKLDTLTIDGMPEQINAINRVIDELREKERFKKLIFIFPKYKKFANTIHKIAWQQLTELKELNICRTNSSNDRQISINTKFPNNIRKITLGDTAFDHILSIVQLSPNITEIVVIDVINNILDSNQLFVKMDELNNKRKKLAGAQRVVIYVDERLYLALKRAGVTEQSLVQIKRNASDANAKY